jgi:anti-sigma factor RsiW
MMEPLNHLDDEQLLLELYGAGAEAAHRHLQACPECGARLAHLKAQRARLMSGMAAPDPAALRAQREAVWARIEKSRGRPAWRALQAGALACAVFAAVLLYRPATPPGPELARAGAEVSDAQLYEDLAAMLARETPAAAEPLLGLFAAPNKNEVNAQ